jgi:hypothetical protein
MYICNNQLCILRIWKISLMFKLASKTCFLLDKDALKKMLRFSGGATLPLVMSIF